METLTFTVSASSALPVPAPTPNASLAAQIAGDMQGKYEGYPHGVPLSYDWATGPVMGMGNNSNGWAAMTAWASCMKRQKATRLLIHA